MFKGNDIFMHFFSSISVLLHPLCFAVDEMRSIKSIMGRELKLVININLLMGNNLNLNRT